MDEYQVEFSTDARQDFEDIYRKGMQRWSFAITDAYVAEIEQRCYGLSHMPHRIGFDRHTQNTRTYHAFEYKAHKVFFTIDETKKVVNIAAVLPSRTHYAVKL